MHKDTLEQDVLEQGVDLGVDADGNEIIGSYVNRGRRYYVYADKVVASTVPPTVQTLTGYSRREYLIVLREWLPRAIRIRNVAEKYKEEAEEAEEEGYVLWFTRHVSAAVEVVTEITRQLRFVEKRVDGSNKVQANKFATACRDLDKLKDTLRKTVDQWKEDTDG
jgi:hypothetical protein